MSWPCRVLELAREAEHASWALLVLAEVMVGSALPVPAVPWGDDIAVSRCRVSRRPTASNNDDDASRHERTPHQTRWRVRYQSAVSDIGYA